ncbi:GNAT family N-acetyltransferase [Streptomyces sp. NPDC004244]|uniref:GNAT family N-acetyltransferase n=1 Tax=Streptomyces sp. NPDC101206 TaxID=3366128 RepID=UPI00380BD12C
MNRPSPTAVERVDHGHRYDLLVGAEHAGRTEYRDRGVQRVFHHTEVDAAFAGQGLAPLLVGEALADVRRSGMRLVPVCPYVAAYLERHREFDDITDPVTPEVLRWLDAELA